MGTLYIVATPIGNLEDITLRALRILKEVDLIACEDTRHTGILLQHYEIKKPLISFHQHSKLQKIQFLVTELKDGKNVALVTDAGTPGIADPAGVLIAKALEGKIKVVPIPGPSVVTAFLSIVGVPSDKFLFLNYLPKKKGRQTLLELIKQNKYPMVILESPNRIIKTLNELKEIIGRREIIVGRELTKKFEEIYRGEIADISDQIRPQGEFIIFVSGKEKYEAKNS